MNNTRFQVALAKAALTNGLDVNKVKADEKMMLMLIDMYYQGGLDGIHKYSEALKEKTNVAVPTIPAPAVS